MKNNQPISYFTTYIKRKVKLFVVCWSVISIKLSLRLHWRLMLDYYVEAKDTEKKKEYVTWVRY